MAAKRAVIVGSGPSAQGFVPPAGVDIIAVNGAIDWLARADYWFTLDPSPANIKRLANKRSGVEYHAAFPENSPVCNVIRYERYSEQGPEPALRDSPEWWFWRWGAVAGLPTEHTRINTGNSAWGALQLAYKLGYTDAALVGVDATQEPRIGGGRPNNLSHLPLLFNSVSRVPGFSVTNCGHMESLLPKMSIQQWL